MALCGHCGALCSMALFGMVLRSMALCSAASCSTALCVAHIDAVRCEESKSLIDRYPVAGTAQTTCSATVGSPVFICSLISLKMCGLRHITISQTQSHYRMQPESA